MASSERAPSDSLRALALEYEAQSESVLRVSEEVRNSVLRLALVAASNVLSVLGSAFGECADDGNAAPMTELSDTTVDWVSQRWDIVPITDEEREAAELARLADDGNPHHEE